MITCSTNGRVVLLRLRLRDDHRFISAVIKVKCPNDSAIKSIYFWHKVCVLVSLYTFITPEMNQGKVTIGCDAGVMSAARQ